MQTWPFFLSTTSRAALISNSPVPVKSCWNGVVVFDAAPFYADIALSFRGIPDSLALHHLEGSECCLIHADNPLSAEKGVWLNPNVRVGYNREAYDAVNANGNRNWPGTWERVHGRWMNRSARLLGIPLWDTEYFTVRWRLWSWKAERRNQLRDEVGLHCLVNEMHVLVSNGWAHV
jgi:hypothetical protein